MKRTKDKVNSGSATDAVAEVEGGGERDTLSDVLALLGLMRDMVTAGAGLGDDCDCD